MTKCKLLAVGLSIFLGSLASVGLSEESTLEKAETVGNESVDGVKSTYRKAKDETCQLVNGKMECVAKKLQNKAKGAIDKTKTKATELKNKVD